jgi:hypothetical protein
MSTSFITFAGGDSNYLEAGSRLCNQANKINLFNFVNVFGQDKN